MAEIQLDPDPPQHGESLIIRYTGDKPVTLKLKWTPDAEESVTITGDDGVKVDVPAGATNLVVTDTSGQAPYRSVPVAP